MRFLTTIRNHYKKLIGDNVSQIDHKQELLVREGREQFKKLIEKGLSIPVAFL